MHFYHKRRGETIAGGAAAPLSYAINPFHLGDFSEKTNSKFLIVLQVSVIVCAETVQSQTKFLTSPTPLFLISYFIQMMSWKR